MNDIEYMRIALDLARKGNGWVSPNPMVGAILVKDGRIIGQGYHKQYGELHAEPNAIASCTESPTGATLYVTLEPCSHYGQQPPCTKAIVESGITRVVIGSEDPNELVSGKGIQYLREHGVLVTEHILQKECDQLNEVFFHYICTKTPFVVMKYAMTMDGKIATQTGLSRWITGEVARHKVHQDRHRYSGIMVGVGTVLQDNPMLDCRLSNSKNPIRIICDSQLRTPLDSNVVTTALKIPTILATCCTDTKRHEPYLSAGCRILTISPKHNRVNLNELMKLLGAEGIDSIMLEGGGTLNWAALESGMVHKVQAYIAPKLFGGATAKTPISGLGIGNPEHAVRLKNTTITSLGEDFLIESEVEHNVYGNC